MPAVIFDMDGVLCESSRDHYLAWKRLAEELGFRLPASYEDRLRGISRAASLEQLLREGHLEGQFHEREKRELMNRKNHFYQQALEEVTPKDLNPGAKQLLEELRKLKIPTALASASRNAPKLLEKLEISSYFHYVVDAATIQKAKPDPEIFLRAAAGLKLDPKQCIGLEDAPAGIESIKRAGMYPLAIGREELFPLDVKSFRNVQEATPYLLQLLKEEKLWPV